MNSRTMIKDLKQMAAGTEIVGLPLTIKTARQTFRDTDGNVIQEVVFIDSSGEMTGHILLEDETARWQSKTNLCIMKAVIQDTDERKKEANKLFVFECFDAATPLTYDQKQELYAEDWQKLQQEQIKGKIRHGLCCSFIEGYVRLHGFMPNIVESRKTMIKEWQDFILTGE